MHTCTLTHDCTCTRVCALMCTHTHMYTHTCVHTRAYIHACTNSGTCYMLHPHTCMSMHTGLTHWASHGTTGMGPDQSRSREPSPWTPACSLPPPTPISCSAAHPHPDHTDQPSSTPGHLHPSQHPQNPHTQLVLTLPPTHSQGHSLTLTSPSLDSADPPTLWTWPPGEEATRRSGRLPPGVPSTGQSREGGGPPLASPKLESWGC